LEQSTLSSVPALLRATRDRRARHLAVFLARRMCSEQKPLRLASKALPRRTHLYLLREKDVVLGPLLLFTPEQFQHQDGRACRMCASGTMESPVFRTCTKVPEKRRPPKSRPLIHDYLATKLCGGPFDLTGTQKHAAEAHESVTDFPSPFRACLAHKIPSDGLPSATSAVSLLLPTRRPFLSP
jgi:hypothetical protein